MRIRDNSLRPICKLNDAGLAGIMLALVWVFVGPLLFTSGPPRGSSVDRPKTSHDRALRDALREDALIVAIQRDGAVYFGSDRITAENLPARIRDGLRAGARDTVYIKADARAKYGTVRETVEAVKAAGITKIAILTDHRRQDGTCCE